MVKPLQVFHRRLVPLKTIVALLILFGVSATETFIIAQQDSSHIKKSTSLMLQFLGPEALGIHVNHNASKRISLNLGIGANLDAHLDVNAYINDRDLSSFSFYGGLQVYLLREFRFSTGNIFGSMGSSSSMGSSTTNKRELQVGLYIPVGVEYIAKKGFSIQLDIGPNFIGEDWGQTNTAPIMGSLKVGYTFRPKH